MSAFLFLVNKCYNIRNNKMNNYMATPSIKRIFKIAVESKASDVHLVANLKPILRIDGILSEIENEKVIRPKELEAMALSLCTEDQIRRFTENKDLDLGFSLEDGSRFRVNLLYEKDNVGLVARVINEVIPTLEELEVPKVIYDLINLEQGLILVTGPTGCGKSTTLAAIINYINENRNTNIITLEDPIEYVFSSKKSIVIQRQLGNDMVFFASGLKHVLRQDPDVIMIGEMRDLETIAATITLAETGHLVLATLHTYSAAQTIDRIIDIFPPHQQNQIRMQLSLTLKGVVSQRLIPRINGGRVVAREIMLNIPATSNLIRENKISQIRTIIETSSQEGMNTMDQDLIRLYNEKKIEKEVAQQRMNNPELLDGKVTTKDKKFRLF